MTEKVERFLTDFVIEQDAEASFNLGGQVNWVKFVVTDDTPNGNRKRIPRSEFSNMIRTGTYMPFKMAFDLPKDGHDDAFPLGVITNLKESENVLEGLAALWTRERQPDVDYIKQRVQEGKLPQLSWEVSYTDSKVDETGIEDLLDVRLNAVCVVGMPAYAGRTPVTAFASQENNLEETSVEELETLKAQLAQLQAELESKKLEAINTLQELETLREYKASIEAIEQESAKLEAIKSKFSEAGLLKEDEYFTSHKDELMGMPEATLNFMIQEMLAMASQKVSNASVETVKVPNVRVEKLDISGPKELGRLLRESKNK